LKIYDKNGWIVYAFISNYIEAYNGELYRWMSSEGNIQYVNYGVFHVTPQGIRELYYISIRYR